MKDAPISLSYGTQPRRRRRLAKFLGLVLSLGVLALGVKKAMPYIETELLLRTYISGETQIREFAKDVIDKFPETRVWFDEGSSLRRDPKTGQYCLEAMTPVEMRKKFYRSVFMEASGEWHYQRHDAQGAPVSAYKFLSHRQDEIIDREVAALEFVYPKNIALKEYLDKLLKDRGIAQGKLNLQEMNAIQQKLMPKLNPGASGPATEPALP